MQSLKIINTQLPPCSLTHTPKGILVGTYDLDKASGIRTGSLNIYDSELEEIKSVATNSAVLDTKCANEHIYTANSTGVVEIYDYDLNKQKTIQLGDSLVTQILVEGTKLGATMTSGDLLIYDLEKESTIFKEKIHELEAWTLEFGARGDPNTIYTGGDDRVLSFTDLRIPYTLWKVKPHEAGVTSILPRDNGMLWTGGYDDCINEFDPRTRRVQNSSNLGGGVWRLIENRSSVLACCMYGGLRILDSTDFTNVKGSLTNHESMVYGGLWLSETEGLTCSFYDKMLQKWSVEN